MSNASSLSRPPAMETNFRRVAILFAGGPAPAANAVILCCCHLFSSQRY